MTAAPMTLYTWWRSQASFRVRIALHLKGLKAEMVFIDLSKDDQFAATYRSINPEMVLPTLIDGEGPPLRQSLAILEYLEEQYPSDRSCRRMHTPALMCAHLRRWWQWMRIRW
jgi:glutathione S-transferase